MPQVIIYQPSVGPIAVIYPTQEALDLHGIQAIAEKDVPAGLPCKIINAADLPPDRSARAGWTVDSAILTDGVGADRNTFE